MTTLILFRTLVITNTPEELIYSNRLLSPPAPQPLEVQAILRVQFCLLDDLSPCLPLSPTFALLLIAPALSWSLFILFLLNCSRRLFLLPPSSVVRALWYFFEDVLPKAFISISSRNSPTSSFCHVLSLYPFSGSSSSLVRVARPRVSVMYQCTCSQPLHPSRYNT